MWVLNYMWGCVYLYVCFINVDVCVNNRCVDVCACVGMCVYILYVCVYLYSVGYTCICVHVCVYERVIMFMFACGCVVQHFGPVW